MAEERKTVKKVKKKVKQKRHVNPMFLWLLAFFACVLFFLTFWNMPMFPRKWSWYVLVVLLLLLGITGIISYQASSRNVFARILNVILCVCMLTASALLPYYKDKVTQLFNTVVGNRVRINLYVMTDEYREEHSDIFAGKDTFSSLEVCYDAVFITSLSIDSENQQYAVSKLQSEFSNSISTIDRTSLTAAADSLYSGEGDVLVLSAAYASLIEDTEGYENFSHETKVIGSFVRVIENSVMSKSNVKLTKKPFMVFFGGNDQEGEISLVGRTDVDMVVAVNPNTHQIAIINLPRDSYVPNPGYKGKYDKLTHLGLLGIGNTLEGLGNYLDQKIDNYVLINFTTYMNIIDALGGVDVYNPYEFTSYWDNVYYAKGLIHLEPYEALTYVRERYNLPDGDFGRNMHQQIVMKALIEKVTSPEVIVHFNSLLNGLQDAFLTNVSSESIYALAQKQLDENISWNIVNYHVLGETDMKECATMPGQKLSVVIPYTNQVKYVSEVINQVFNGDILKQEELPEGSYDTED